MFSEVTRSEMREIFQPSRVVLVVVRDNKNNRWNFFPVAFNMYCGYNPLTYCFAVHDINYSYELLSECEEFAIAVPGEQLVDVTMESGLCSGSEIDKFERFGLVAILDETEQHCYGISECMLNLYCRKKEFLKVSDHAIVVGKVCKIFRDYGNIEKNILSISKQTEGYKLLRQKGIHRLAIK